RSEMPSFNRWIAALCLILSACGSSASDVENGGSGGSGGTGGTAGGGSGGKGGTAGQAGKGGAGGETQPPGPDGGAVNPGPDGGRASSWMSFSTGAPGISDVAYGRKLWVAVSGNYAVRSTDTVKWPMSDGGKLADNRILRRMRFVGTRFIAWGDKLKCVVSDD